jgi:hypothetical protein
MEEIVRLSSLTPPAIIIPEVIPDGRKVYPSQGWILASIQPIIEIHILKKLDKFYPSEFTGVTI